MKNLLRLHARIPPVVRIYTFADAISLHFFNWKINLLVSCFKKCHYEQHRNNYSIPHKIWPVQEKIEIMLFFSICKFGFLIIYIQIVSNIQNKIMKTLSCTANKSVCRYVTYYSKGCHCTAILMILWNQEATFNIVRLLCIYPFEWHSNISHLIDLLECNTNSWKCIETTER